MMLETWQAGNLADLPRSSSGADPSPARRIQSQVSDGERRGAFRMESSLGKEPALIPWAS